LFYARKRHPTGRKYRPVDYYKYTKNLAKGIAVSAENCMSAAKTLPLEAINDHNPKYLLTMDHTPLTSHNGIK